MNLMEFIKFIEFLRNMPVGYVMILSELVVFVLVLLFLHPKTREFLQNKIFTEPSQSEMVKFMMFSILENKLDKNIQRGYKYSVDEKQIYKEIELCKKHGLNGWLDSRIELYKKLPYNQGVPNA